MVEEAAESGGTDAVRNVKAELDERRIARAAAIGLPIVTLSVAAVMGVLIGPAMAILALTSGMLLGVVALFWASLRILSGDAALSPELEALDATAHAVDALSSRKKMLVRALKDLDNERALGKLEDEDYEQLSLTYRAELKDVLRRIDASLEPLRPKAEDAARAYLVKAGLVEDGIYRGARARTEAAAGDDEEVDPSEVARAAKRREDARVECPSCTTSNEGDAGFCKKCGASLARAPSGESKDAAASAAVEKGKTR